MPDNTNTLQGLLADILRREKNSLEIIQKLNDIFSSKDDKVIIEYALEDGSIQEIEIPSYGYLLSEMRRLTENQYNFSGINTTKASIKLQDGSKKIIYSNELPLEPKIIQNVEKPLLFHKKANKVVNQLLDPVPFIRFDLTNKIASDVDKIYVKTLKLNLQTISQADYFASIEGTSIEYSVLLQGLTANGIDFEEYDEIKDLAPKSPKFSGLFDVENISKKTINVEIDGKFFPKDVLVYKLNTLYYKDVELSKTDVSLKTDDILIVNVDNKIRNTRLKISSVDQGTNEVILENIEGYDVPATGIGKLLIDPSYINKVLVDCEILNSEFDVFFFKAINPNSNIVNLEWGNGTPVKTDELIFADDQVNNVKLSVYKDSNIDDVKANLKTFALEKMIPLASAIKPNIPILNLADVKVLPVNTHKNEVESTNKLKEKLADKNKVKSELDALDKSISSTKEKLSSLLLSANEIENFRKSLDQLNKDRDGKVKEYNTVINDIVARKKEFITFQPKYRARTFFNEPEPQYTDAANKIGKQEIIGSIYRYRYLRPDNSATEADAFKYQNAEGKEIKATFSKWIEVKNKLKQKKIDEVTGKSVWVIDDVINPDVLNSNQIDIPISQGESVEIQVKAISEAGHPVSPAESDWSEPIIVEFPKELIDDLTTTLAESDDEAIRAKFLNELSVLGVTKHIEESVTIGDLYFPHSGDSIASPFRTPENKPKGVNQVLKEQAFEIEKLTALINAGKGQIQVTIFDENGNLVKKVNNNETVNIFAGYYKDIVSQLQIQKGAVVSKLYYIEIENINAVDLELLSYVPGAETDQLPIGDVNEIPFYGDQGGEYAGYIINVDEYNRYRRHWEVPISLRGITDNADFKSHHLNTQHPFIELPTFQSKQVKGMFLMGRNFDIALSKTLYDGWADSPILQTLLPTSTGGGSAQSFIWDESLTTITPNGNGVESNFCVHIDHPALLLNSDLMNNFTTVFNAITKLPIKTVETTGEPYYPFFCNAEFANLPVTDVNGEKQLAYVPHIKVNSGATAANFARKLGFNLYDQYLIGKDTVGSYLFLAPNVHKDLHTGEIIYNKGKLVQKGNENKIRIPVLFQARMTDYYGAGSTGTGVLGGFNSPANQNNLVFAKKVGFDIPIKGQDIFSFDIRVEMQYKSKSVSII